MSRNRRIEPESVLRTLPFHGSNDGSTPSGDALKQEQEQEHTEQCSKSPEHSECAVTNGGTTKSIGTVSALDKFRRRQAAWSARAASLRDKPLPTKRQVERRALLNAIAASKPRPPKMPRMKRDKIRERIAHGRSCGVRNWIYFVEPEDKTAVKIGLSGDPYDRLSELQVGNHQRLRLIAVVPGGKLEEEDLHAKLHRHRISGEWFRSNEDVRAAILRALQSVRLSDMTPVRRRAVSP